MTRIAIVVPECFSSQSRSRLVYVLACINSSPIAKKASCTLILGESAEYRVGYGVKDLAHFVPRQNLLFSDKIEKWYCNSYNIKESTVYSVEGIEKRGNLFNKEIGFDFDIFESIFFHLSRYEERTLKQHRYFGNKIEFEKKLFLVENGIEKIAVVDELVKAFLEIILNISIDLPRDKVLTHDIDFVKKFKHPFSIVRKIAGHFRHRKSFKGFGYLWKSYFEHLIQRKDAFDTFDWMLREEDINKTIYFLVGGDHDEDNKFDLGSEVVRKAIRLAKERNYDIGIHPSYESWHNVELIKRQKLKLEEEIGKSITKSRQHFLNFDIDITPSLLEEAGILEDSSIGYTRHTGYRCGTGFAYPLYNFTKEETSKVVEMPLVFMDVAWLFEAERRGDFTLTEQINDFYGSFNFHNSTFDEMAARSIKMKDFYIDSLKMK